MTDLPVSTDALAGPADVIAADEAAAAHASAPQPEFVTSPQCANCQQELSGRYCSSCGQRVVAPRPTLHDLTHEAVHEFAHVDGKIVQTLKLLVTSPGLLTREFLDGRRARYIAPIRLYLLCSVLFFVAVASLPEQKHWKFTSSGRSIEGMEKGLQRANSDPAIVGESLKHNVPKAMFVLMPLFGALIFAFYRRAESTYVPHLYFALHYHAFLFVLLTGTAILASTPLMILDLLAVLLVLGSFPYLAVALRSVYGGGRVVTLAKAATIWLVYGFIVLFSVLGLTLLAIVRAGRA